jgi:outer membrane protein OmpA-like peptidoglycan-associated protein
MIRRRSPIAGLTACAITLTIGCASHKTRTPEYPGQAVVALLPDPETGYVGRATVSNAEGRVELSQAREATVATARTAPAPVHVMSPGDVRSLFGDVLDALPPPQRHFTLFFRFDSEELTPESRSLAPEILRAVRDRRLPDVLVVGHTDRTGGRATNFTLGLRRATSVRNLLRQTGLDVGSIDIVSHGESEPLVPTADGVFEPKNRRVEITVR